ncbi:MAG: hypothetical protein V9E98_14940 [Candidatus Nanopelagicales bacterium]
MDQGVLIDTTVRLGFNNVIDAFHKVGGSDVSTRFFIDERKTATRGIVLTDSVHALTASDLYSPIEETEARWRLVESAWDLGLDTSLVRVDSDLHYLLSNDRRSNDHVRTRCPQRVSAGIVLLLLPTDWHHPRARQTSLMWITSSPTCCNAAGC